MNEAGPIDHLSIRSGDELRKELTGNLSTPEAAKVLLEDRKLERMAKAAEAQAEAAKVQAKAAKALAQITTCS